MPDEPSEQPQAPDLSEAAAAFSNASNAIKTLEVRRDELSQKLAELDADIAASRKSQDDARNRMAAAMGNVR